MSAINRAAALLGGRVQRDAPLGARTTYRVGGDAALLFEVRDEVDLARASAAAVESKVEVLVVGKGSNLLVADAGFVGLAVVLGESFAQMEISAGVIRAGGAIGLPVLARRSASDGWTGLEWAVGVPGSLGGAVRMNAGGHGSDIAAVLDSARVVDLATGTDEVVAAGDLALGYRRSAVTRSQVVVSADLRARSGDRSAALSTIDEIVRWRRANQPGGQNAGSVFVNPPGDSAGRLVDEAGLKGHAIGSASVSGKHANFIQAEPGGSADDVLALIRDVARRVEDHAGVRLEPEVRLIGFAR